MRKWVSSKNNIIVFVKNKQNVLNSAVSFHNGIVSYRCCIVGIKYTSWSYIEEEEELLGFFSNLISKKIKVKEKSIKHYDYLDNKKCDEDPIKSYICSTC